MENNHFRRSDFDGCCYGLKTKTKRNEQNPKLRDDDGCRMLLKKPWCVAFSDNIPMMGDRLNKRCPNCKQNFCHQHAECAGNETKDTEKYTWSVAREVHRAFKEFCDEKQRFQLDRNDRHEEQGVFRRLDILEEECEHISME